MCAPKKMPMQNTKIFSTVKMENVVRKFDIFNIFAQKFDCVFTIYGVDENNKTKV